MRALVAGLLLTLGALSVSSCTAGGARIVDCAPGYHNVSGPASDCVKGSAGSTTGTTPAPSSSAAEAMPFDLLTHCGIDEARIGMTFFEAETPLVGEGNPPPDWDKPFQHGTMTLVSPSRAVFQDAHGHSVYFRARPGATTFKSLCA